MRPLATLLLVGAVLCAGCSARVARTPEVVKVAAPAQARVDGVPLIRQADRYCGPASLAMILQWSGQSVTQEDLASLAFSPGAKGTFQADMAGAARRNGRLSVQIHGFPSLLKELSAGHPVIVFENRGLTGLPLWHYSVAVGYDLQRRLILLHSGDAMPEAVPLDRFSADWRRAGEWGLLVLPPGRLPAGNDQMPVLEAAAALERAGHPAAAADTYRAGERRWPGNWLWPFGLGNALYAQGDANGARRAYLRAVTLDPDAPEPRHNLKELAING